MSLSATLLKKLDTAVDHDILVVDCADCGRLTTFIWAAFRLFRHLGLRLGGGWRPSLRGDHRRPLCKQCWEEIPREQLPHPTSGRTH